MSSRQTITKAEKEAVKWVVEATITIMVAITTTTTS